MVWRENTTSQKLSHPWDARSLTCGLWINGRLVMSAHSPHTTTSYPLYFLAKRGVRKSLEKSKMSPGQRRTTLHFSLEQRTSRIFACWSDTFTCLSWRAALHVPDHRRLVIIVEVEIIVSCVIAEELEAPQRYKNSSFVNVHRWTFSTCRFFRFRHQFASSLFNVRQLSSRCLFFTRV